MAKFTHEDAIDIDGWYGRLKIEGTEQNDLIDTTNGTKIYIIESGDGDDTVWANSRSEVIETGAGADSIYTTQYTQIHGGDGNDTISATLGNNSIYGDNGDDEIKLEHGDDNTVSAGNGADKVTGASGSDSISGGAGHDTIYGNLGADTLYGNEGDDVIYGGDGRDVIVGDSLNIDSVIGNDKLFGEDGSDEIYGNAGDDLISGGNGNDQVDGGTGFDTAIINVNKSDVIGYYVKTYNDPWPNSNIEEITIISDEGVDTYRNIESFQFLDQTIQVENLETALIDFKVNNGNTFYVSSSNTQSATIYDDRITISSSSANINSLAGNDTIAFNIFDEDAQIDGGSGIDTLQFNYSSKNLDAFIEHTDGTFEIFTSQQHLEVKNVENIEFTDKSFSKDEFNNSFSNLKLAPNAIIGTKYGEFDLSGTDSDDLIFSWRGHDGIDGKNGIDTLALWFPSTDVTELRVFGGWKTTIHNEHTNDSYDIQNIEFIKFTDKTVSFDNLGSELLKVNTANQTILGTSDSDTLYTGLGDDVVNGFTGSDTVVMELSTEDISSYGREEGIVTFGSSEKGIDTFENVEYFQFKDMKLALNSLDSEFAHVNTKNETFYSTSGDDYFDGGLGDNTVVLDIATTDVTAFFQGDDWRNYFNFSEGTAIISSNKGNDTFINIDNFQFKDKTLEARDLALTFQNVRSDDQHITGFNGNDTLIGGFGNDLIEAYDGSDIIFGGEGDDIIYADYLPFNFHFSSLDDTVDGGKGNDTIYTGPGTNTIKGGDGNDIISTITPYGDATKNTIDGGQGEDEVVFDFSSTSVDDFSLINNQVHISADGDHYINNVETFQFTDKSLSYHELVFEFSNVSTNGKYLTGTGENDNLVGTLGDDTVSAGAGLNYINGMEGIDTVVLPFATTEVSVYRVVDGEVEFTANGIASYKIKNAEQYEFTDKTYTFDELSSAFARVNTAPQILFGTNGNDLLTGGLADDTFTPRAGDDQVSGVSGRDTAIINIDTSKVTGYSNDGINVVITSTEGVDTLSNIDVFKFNDITLNYADLDQAFAKVTVTSKTIFGDENDNTLTGALANDTITPGKGNDEVDGAAGVDTVAFNIDSSDVKGLSINSGKIIITSSEGVDVFTNVELFKFSDKAVAVEDLSAAFASVITDDQRIEGDDNANTLKGALGNDTIVPKGGDDTVDGSEGEDTAILNLASTAVIAYSINGDSVTISSAENNDHFERIESFKFTDKTINLQDLDSVLSAILIKDQTFTSTASDDEFIGGDGNDIAIFGYASADLNAVTKDGEFYKVSGTEGVDTLSKIERLQFTDQTLTVADLMLGTQQSETITGTAADDIIDAGNGLDSIHAGDGDDLIINAEIGEFIDGGDGLDLVKYNFASTEVSSIMRKLDGSIELSTANATSMLDAIDQIAFTDTGMIEIDLYIASKNPLKPTFNAIVKGKSIAATPEAYTGGVDFLEFQLLGDAEGNIVTGSAFNDFLNLLDGDDAANGGAGRDVLDGGTGSNFLTGGADADTFFLDGRGGTTTWSTITDFDGDNVNIWGWVDGVSQLIQSIDDAGAEGYTGATFHYDLNNDGAIDTSITFSGLTIEQLPNGSAQEVGGNGYLLFA